MQLPQDMGTGAEAMPTDEIPGSISLCLAMLKKGDQAAAQTLWAAYFQRLVGLARSRLQGLHRGGGDEEDIALSALKSLLVRAERGEFPQLADRDDLWQLLYVITVRKAITLAKRERALRRGGGAVCYLSEFEGTELEGAVDAEPNPDLALQVAEECRRLLDLLADETLSRIALWKMEGYTNKEVARKLGVVEQTVERKVRRIRELWSARGMS
jgi:DNA-directed RNA polymerase specialized sigma24 family protein